MKLMEVVYVSLFAHIVHYLDVSLEKITHSCNMNPFSKLTIFLFYFFGPFHF